MARRRFVRVRGISLPRTRSISAMRSALPRTASISSSMRVVKSLAIWKTVAMDPMSGVLYGEEAGSA